MIFTVFDKVPTVVGPGAEQPSIGTLWLESELQFISLAPEEIAAHEVIAEARQRMAVLSIRRGSATTITRTLCRLRCVRERPGYRCAGIWRSESAVWFLRVHGSVLTVARNLYIPRSLTFLIVVPQPPYSHSRLRMTLKRRSNIQ